MRFSGILAVFFILEIIVIMQVGSTIGGLWTIGWLLLDMVIGAFLISNSGMSPGKPLRSDAFFTRGGNPIIMLLRCFAGLLFIFPGFISDIVGVLVLLPVSRELILLLAGKFLRHGSALHQVYTFGYQAGQGVKRERDPLKEAFFRQARQSESYDGHAESSRAVEDGDGKTDVIIEGEFRDVTDDDAASKGAGKKS